MPVIFASLVFAISLSLLPYVTEDHPDPHVPTPYKDRQTRYEDKEDKIDLGLGLGLGPGLGLGQTPRRVSFTLLSLALALCRR